MQCGVQCLPLAVWLKPRVWREHIAFETMCDHGLHSLVLLTLEVLPHALLHFHYDHP